MKKVYSNLKKRLLVLLLICSCLLINCTSIGIVHADSTPTTFANAADHLNIPTYDGSGQNVHPSVVYFPNGWNGYKYWMAMTAYPFADDAIENPSIVVSNDGTTWSVPAGLVNPLAPRPSQGHNNDVELVYSQPNNSLFLYYLEANDSTTTHLKIMTSTNGINWSAPATCFTSEPGQKYGVLSPAVVYNSGENKYYMWSVNSGDVGSTNQDNTIELRTSDGGAWSSPVTCNFPAKANLGLIPWHIEVQYIPEKNEYWMVYNAYPTGGNCNSATKLYFAKSTDRINWTVDSTPLLNPGPAGSWDAWQIYRTSFLYDAPTNKLRLWYGGVSSNNTSTWTWYTGYTEGTYDRDVESPTRTPTLTISNSSIGNHVLPAYNDAVACLVDRLTKPWSSEWNTSGFMDSNYGYIVAGGAYDEPWQRDTGFMTYDAANLLEWREARNMIYSQLEYNSNNKLWVKEGFNGSEDQYWDKIVWSMGAWDQYLVTGDKTYLGRIYEAVTETLNHQRDNHFNDTYGVFTGGTVLDDNIDAYSPPVYDYWRGTAAMAYPVFHTIMGCSNNLAWYRGYIIAAKAAQELGKPQSEIDNWNNLANDLKNSINNTFWKASSHRYIDYIESNGTKQDVQNDLAQAWAILFGVADSVKAADIVNNIHYQPMGIPHKWPDFHIFTAEQPSREGNILWGNGEAAWAEAMGYLGKVNLLSREINSIASGWKINDGNFRETLNSVTGIADGGWESDGEQLEPSNIDQGWSATGFIKSIYRGVFGMSFETDGLQFKPNLPSDWGETNLNSIKYRNMVLNVKLTGAGNVIDSFKLDGVLQGTSKISSTLSGTHNIEIALSGEERTIGDTIVEDAIDNNNANSISAFGGYTLDKASTIQSISIFVKEAAGNCRLAIYSDNNGSPGSKQAETAAFTPIVGWNTVPVQTPINLAVGTYWLSYLTDSNSLVVASTTTGSNQKYASCAYGTMPANFPTSNDGIMKSSLYATFGSGGSILFSSGLEAGNTQPTWSDTVEGINNVTGYFSRINPECSIRNGEQANSGSAAIMFSGTDNSASSSYCYYKVFDVNIPITSSTKLSYWFLPQQQNGRYVAIDLMCTDGTSLRDSGATDYNGVRMHPNAGHGTINTWSQIQSNVGQWLNGKTIDRILIGYDQPGSTGQYRGYIDDIMITN